MKRVADTFVEVSLVFGFCCWLTPIPLTVLCVSTCSDGLLDFHRPQKQVNELNNNLVLSRESNTKQTFRSQILQSKVHIITGFWTPLALIAPTTSYCNSLLQQGFCPKYQVSCSCHILRHPTCIERHLCFSFSPYHLIAISPWCRKSTLARNCPSRISVSSKLSFQQQRPFAEPLGTN